MAVHFYNNLDDIERLVAAFEGVQRYAALRQAIA